MPNTKITRDRWKNHMHYSKMIYLIVIVVAGMLGDILYTVTTYHAPNARRVDIEFVGPFVDFSNAEPFSQTAMEAGIAYERARDEAAGIDVNSADYEPALQEVEFYSVDYDPSSDDAAYGQQKLMVTLAAQEGDIFVVSRSLMVELVQEGLATDLTPYIENGVIDPGERDLSRVTFSEYVDQGEEPTGNKCVYALQTEDMMDLWDAFQHDYRETYMVMMCYSQNQDTTAAVMQSLIDQFTPSPEEIARREAEIAARTAELEAEAAAALVTPVPSDEPSAAPDGKGTDE